jgi:hypothetical protein
MLSKKIIVVGLNSSGVRSLEETYDVYWISVEPQPIIDSSDDYHSLRECPDYYFSGSSQRLDAVIAYVRTQAISIYETYARHWKDRLPISVPEFEVLLYSHIFWAYNLIDKFNPEKIIFLNLPHEGFDNILQHCAHAMGIKTACLYNLPFAPYHWVIERGSDLSNLPFTIQEGMLGKTLSKKHLDYYVLQFLLKCAGIGKHWYMGGDINRVLISFEEVREVINTKILTYKKNRPDIPYAYFPLHLQPELTTAILGGIYSNQLFAIKKAAEWAADNGWCLIVKENPIQGNFHRGPFFMKALEAIPNIFMVDSSQNTHDLIGRSECVITITGTAGIEGLVLGKPVVCLGDIYYKKFNGLVSFTGQQDWKNYRPPTLLDIYSNIITIMNCAYLGASEIDCGKFYEISDRDNTKNLVDSIKNIMR